MKLYVYFLSLLIVIMPIYANALTPIHAIGATVAGEVAVGVGKATIKKMPTETRKKLVKNATGMCAKSLLSFAFCDSLINAMVGDGIDIDVDITNNEVNFYDSNDVDECKIIDVIRTNNYKGYGKISEMKKNNILRNKDEIMSILNKNTYYDYDDIRVEKYPTYDRDMTRARQLAEQNKDYFCDKVDYGDYSYYRDGDSVLYSVEYMRDGKTLNTAWQSINLYGSVAFVKIKGKDKRKITDDELEEYFKKIAKGDDITNIYNYDYSDNSITVNGEKMDGNDLNKRKNDFDKNYEDKNLSKEATDKMKRKKKDYDIDDINDENCDKNEQGEYDKCGSDREKEKELDEYCKKYPSEKICQERQKEKETDEHCEKNPQDSYCKAREDAKKKKEQEEKLCKLNPEHSSCKKDEDKKDDGFDFCKTIPLLCDWSLPDFDNGKLDFEEPKIDFDSKATKDYIKFGGSCPAPVVVPIEFMGSSQNLTISYEPFCEFASKIKPAIILGAWLSGLMIISGGRGRE